MRDGDMTAREGDGDTWLTNPGESSDASSGLTSAGTSPVRESVTAEAPTANNGALPASEVVLPVDLPTLLRELENTYIEAALLRTQRNKKEAAKLLGMGRTTLVEKLRRRGRLASSGA